MPPRLPSSSKSPSDFNHLLSLLRFQCLCQQRSRRFSSTPKPSQSTRQRRLMFQWMNGPGSAFRNPLPGSTNYLGAYDKDGELFRVKKTRPKTEGETEDEGDENDGPLSRQKNLAGDEPLPKEQPGDFVPFPLNRQFRSQPVLSEELKDEIYKRIVLQGQSVQVVSAELQVEMRRVGAVVRLKSVEKQWVDQVSLVLSSAQHFQRQT